jgi:hypothetical protein
MDNEKSEIDKTDVHLDALGLIYDGLDSDSTIIQVASFVLVIYSPLFLIIGVAFAVTIVMIMLGSGILAIVLFVIFVILESTWLGLKSVFRWLNQSVRAFNNNER